MQGLRFIPSDTQIPFTRFRMFGIVLSSILVLASLFLFFAVNLNYGIDFRGGTLIEIRTKDGPADLADLRGRLGGIGLGDVQIQEFGDPSEVLIRIEQQAGGEENQQRSIQLVKDTLGDIVDYRRVEVVGPTVSGELIQSGTIAVVAAIFAVLLYIWFRFEWQFAIGAVVALVHDVILTIGIFCLLQLEFNLSIIAAILTIVGYSLNDTVVVFDRVRENLRKFKKMELRDLVDLSLNETLSRTILTSVTTLLALGSLYAFGGQVIRGFTFAMIWGVVVGTYSSIFIASPVLMMLGVNRDRGSSASPKLKEPALRRT